MKRHVRSENPSVEEILATEQETYEFINKEVQQ